MFFKYKEDMRAMMIKKVLYEYIQQCNEIKTGLKDRLLKCAEDFINELNGFLEPAYQVRIHWHVQEVDDSIPPATEAGKCELRNGMFTIRNRMGAYSVNLHKIKYFKKDEPNLIVVCDKAHPIESLRENITLREVMELLEEEPQYMRFNRSYILRVDAPEYRDHQYLYLFDRTKVRFCEEMAEFCLKNYPTKSEWMNGKRAIL
jgi:hypothetical protein